MPDYTVRQYGTDSSGRPVYMSAYMHDWWEQVCDELGFEPTIVQGAHMARAGGGASASAGFHDLQSSRPQGQARKRKNGAVWIKWENHGAGAARRPPRHFSSTRSYTRT